jgi:hypothetical protein
MHSLLQRVSCCQEDDIHEEITRDFGNPYAGPIEKIAQDYVYKNGKSDEQEYNAGYGGPYHVQLLDFFVNWKPPFPHRALLNGRN